MRHQSYVIAYDTEEQLRVILDIIKRHNESGPYSNEFVRLDSQDEYEQLEHGEVLTHIITATLKTPYKDAREGPVLSKVALCGHGGGRYVTFPYFDWELPRRIVDPRVRVYGFSRAIDMGMTNKQNIPQERVGGDENSSVIPESASDVRPALFITRSRRRSELDREAHQQQPSISYTYTTKEAGFVVGKRRFAIFKDAELDSFEWKCSLAKYRERQEANIASNKHKYKQLRAAGKEFYLVTMHLPGGIGEEKVYKWLTKEAASSERVAANKQVSICDVLVMKGEDKEKMSTEDVDAAILGGEDIKILYL